MGLLICVISAALLGTGPAVDASKDVEAIIKKSIEAHGGEQNLAKLKSGRVKSTMKGTLPGAGETDLTVEDLFLRPNRFKKVIQGTSAGREVSMTWAIIGHKYWVKQGGQITEASSEKGAEQQFHPFVLFENLILLRENPGELVLTAEIKHDGRVLTGVKRSTGETPQVWYFDKSTGLLVKTSQKKNISYPDPEKMAIVDRELLVEGVFSDCKAIDGLTLPMRQTVFHDGRKGMEIIVTEAKFGDKLDDKLFEKP